MKYSNRIYCTVNLTYHWLIDICEIVGFLMLWETVATGHHRINMLIPRIPLLEVFEGNR